MTFVHSLYHKSVFENWIRYLEPRDKRNNRLVIHSLIFSSYFPYFWNIWLLVNRKVTNDYKDASYELHSQDFLKLKKRWFPTFRYLFCTISFLKICSSWTSTIIKGTDKYSSIWIGHKICVDAWCPFLHSFFMKPTTSSFHWEPGSLHTAFLCIKLCAILCIKLSLHTWDGVAVAVNNVTTSLRHLCNRILDRKTFKTGSRSDLIVSGCVCICLSDEQWVSREHFFLLVLRRKNQCFKNWAPANEKAWGCLPSLWTI